MQTGRSVAHQDNGFGCRYERNNCVVIDFRASTALALHSGREEYRLHDRLRMRGELSGGAFDVDHVGS
jgi:hypothetical protein